MSFAMVQEIDWYLNSLYFEEEMERWDALSIEAQSKIVNRAIRDVFGAFAYEANGTEINSGTDKTVIDTAVAADFIAAIAEQAYSILNNQGRIQELRESGVEQYENGIIIKHDAKFTLCSAAYQSVAKYIKKPEIVRG